MWRIRDERRQGKLLPGGLSYKNIPMKPANLIFLLLFVASYVSSGQALSTEPPVYRDGVYTGMSRAKYTGEPYWGKVQVTIRDGKFTGIIFSIRDSALHETFDAGYARHFAGNELYIQQTKNDSRGVQVYPGKLMDGQDTAKVDAVSGATWSYNIFMASLREALKQAVISQ